jgi:hypothetical protein
MVRGAAKVVEYLPSKHEAWSSNHSTKKKKLINNNNNRNTGWGYRSYF